MLQTIIEPERQHSPQPSMAKPHAPGVYFSLPMSEYHADPSLGSSDIRALLVHPAAFWARSRFNPNRVDHDTLAKKIGRALHSLVLEGEAGFARDFIQEPRPEDFPEALASAEDMRNFIRRNVIKGVGGTTKADMAKAIKAFDPTVKIWDDIKSLFDVMVLRDELETLKPDAMAEVRAAAAAITLNPNLANAFRGGVPEVSVFWDDDGVPCKARFDYVKPRTLINLKKIGNARERPIDVAIANAIAEYRYDLGARFHLEGWGHLVDAACEGRVFGDCPLSDGWGERIAGPDDVVHTWIFHVMDGPPITVGRQIGVNSAALNKATREIAAAKATYRRCLDKYGTSRWVADEPISDLVADDLPVWMREDVGVF